MPDKPIRRLASLSLLLAPGAFAGAQPTFTPLGDLPGGQFSSVARAVNADGTVVAGAAEAEGGQEPFVWNQRDGMISLGKLYDEGNANLARGVSADGSVVVGTTGFAHSPREAFRWNQAEGLVGLGDLPGAIVSSNGNAVSADGLVVVGRATDDNGFQPARWNAAEGWQVLDIVSGEALGISADASTIVGVAQNADFFNEAFRWTDDEGIVFLGDLPGGIFSSSAAGVSADGSVIVGTASDDTALQAFRWTAGTGLVAIAAELPGATSSQATSVSAEGDVIVGDATTDAGFVPFLWNSDAGPVYLEDYLLQQGAAGLEGWTLTNAGAVSADGNTIVGAGFNPDGDIEAFVVHLESACPADINGDGNLNILDFVAFQTSWAAQNPLADCDANGAFNILDFVCYQILFAAGCP